MAAANPTQRRVLLVFVEHIQLVVAKRQRRVVKFQVGNMMTVIPCCVGNSKTLLASPVQVTFKTPIIDTVQGLGSCIVIAENWRIDNKKE